MPASTEQRDWVKRVLGFDPDDPAVGAGADAALDRLAIWREAKETVDARLETLAKALRAVRDPDFDRIAEFGLFGLTDGEAVALNRALREYGAAPADKRPAAAKALRDAVAGYRAAMASEGMFALLDENPFGVAIASRATLGVALDAIERSLG